MIRIVKPIESASAGMPDHPVWEALSRYEVGPADASLGFQERLARENGWCQAYAGRVVEEYRRFCFLAVVAGHPVTPSDAVDQAWHLHLTYSRDYWERFCPVVLGIDLHHAPTKGGTEETGRFFEQYARTLQAYERTFGAPAPADIWPSAARRLLDDPRARRVHPREGRVLSRSAILAVILLAFLVGTIAGAAFVGVIGKCHWY